MQRLRPATRPRRRSTSNTLVAQSDVPEVEIRSPGDNTEVLINNEVQVYVRAVDRVGVTRIEMRVDGQIVDTAASPEANGSPTMDSILSWTPNSTGSHVLQVVAFRGSLQGNPKSITLTVKQEAAQITAPAMSPVFLTASPTVDPTCRVRADVTVNVRSGPGINYPIVTSLAVGSNAPILGTNDDASWYEIDVQGIDGWVSSSFVTQQGICSNVQSVPVPPSPTVPVGATAIVIPPSFTPLPTFIPPYTIQHVPDCGAAYPDRYPAGRCLSGGRIHWRSDFYGDFCHANSTRAAAYGSPDSNADQHISARYHADVCAYRNHYADAELTNTPVLPNLVISGVTTTSTTVVLNPVQKLATVPFDIKVANLGDRARAYFPSGNRPAGRYAR